MANTILKLTLAVLLTLGAVTAATIVGSAGSQKFYPDDPMPVERDTQDASGMKVNDVNLFVDLTYNLIKGGEVINTTRAANVNTIDEVPDSSWYTNRIGQRALTPADMTVGPNTSAGPLPGPWTITSSKSDGVTPGFTIKDSSGQRWFLKFDPRGYRGMATGTEVTVTKLMWALGYNVPENHIAYMTRQQLVVGAEAKYTPAGGTARAMRADDVDKLLARADRERDGRYRVVASRALPGKPIGRIRFAGVRPDDPNDVVPHEDRRELRGYGVFAAWLNHVDAKAINSLDTLVTENGRSYVRHHLIDFGSSLGSGGVAPAEYSAGHEYLVEPKLAASQMFSLGLKPAKWHTMPFYEAPSIGRMQRNNADFNPELWKPRVPNQAFLHARADDKFWAARKLMAMNTDLIRAAVAAGEFGDPQSEEFLVRALAQRRDAIVRAYLTAVNPVAEPRLEGNGVLTFSNAAVDADVARAPQGYRGVWSTFDNVLQTADRVGLTTAASTSMQAPANLPMREGTYIQVDLSAVGSDHPTWEVPVQVYFHRLNGEWKLVGFERLP